MKAGEVMEIALWTDGRESAEMLTQLKADMAEALDAEAKRQRLVLAPMRFHEKRPGGDRVPNVPAHIQGPNVRLLVGEALITGQVSDHLVPMARHSFLADLDPIDLTRLRAITRRVARRNGYATLSTAQIDAMIEQAGPDAAYDAVRAAVDSRAVH